MAHYERLKKQLKPKPYLVADAQTGEVKLVSQATAVKLMTESSPFSTRAIINLGDALPAFARIKGVGKKDRVFGMKEVAKIAGMSYHASYYYVAEDVISPSVRPFGGSGRGEGVARFSWADAFTAGVVGCLRRQGLKIDALRQVSRLFTKSRASRKVASSAKP